MEINWKLLVALILFILIGVGIYVWLSPTFDIQDVFKRLAR